jgi:hypothetical protein
MSSLIATADGIAVATPFDRRFVDEFKLAVPNNHRRWNAAAKQWIVTEQYAKTVASLIRLHFGESVTVPTALAAPAAPSIKLAQMLYLGRCKERGSGESTASGYADGAWSLSFPESLLRAWFCDDGKSAAAEDAGPKSLYAVLGIPAFSEFEAIKVAYRRMAKVWHPDVSKEQDSKERFQAINHAYDVLKDDKQRRKYDVGLTLELRTNKQTVPVARYTFADYRAPLTCGMVLLEGVSQLGVFQVGKILQWDDITNDQGQTLVSSWPTGADNFETRWV